MPVDPISIRLATREDIAALGELRATWEAEQRGVVRDGEFGNRFRAWCDREWGQRTFWLALSDQDPIGMVNLCHFERMPTPGTPSGGWGYLANMFVVADHRSRGVGTRMVAAVLEHADASGFERVVLNPSERSRLFYSRAGFSPANTLLVRSGHFD
jgi:GNAT superfamily N-acetyltransferase